MPSMLHPSYMEDMTDNSYLMDNSYLADMRHLAHLSAKRRLSAMRESLNAMVKRDGWTPHRRKARVISSSLPPSPAEGAP